MHDSVPICQDVPNKPSADRGKFVNWYARERPVYRFLDRERRLARKLVVTAGMTIA